MMYNLVKHILLLDKDCHFGISERSRFEFKNMGPRCGYDTGVRNSLSNRD